MNEVFHEKQLFFIAPVATANELAEKVTQMTWTLCTAFSLGDYPFLNDSTSEDGAQEYSVVKRQGDTFCQIESVTFGWMTLEGALKFIEETLAGTSDKPRTLW